MFPEPSSEAPLIEITARQGEDRNHNLFLGGIDTKPIQTKKEVHGLEGHPFVSVNEGVVLRDPEAVCCSQRRKIGVGLVMALIPRTFEGRFQKPPITKAARPAVGLDLIGVDGENVDHTKPAWLGHLASSRIALRYRLAPSA